MIDNHRTQCKWKVKLVMAINCFSYKDPDETRAIHTTSDSIVMMGNETDDIIENLFDSYLQRYQKVLEESLKGSEFVFHSVDLLYYKLQKISLN